MHFLNKCLNLKFSFSDILYYTVFLTSVTHQLIVAYCTGDHGNHKKLGEKQRKASDIMSLHLSLCFSIIGPQ